VLTLPRGLNSAGDVVGVFNTPDGKQHGFLWSKGTFSRIDVPGATLTAANGMNPSGDIVVRYDDTEGKRHNLVLSRGHTLPIPNFPGSAVTEALRISPSGDIVGFYVTGGKTHGFVLRSPE
jgi:probable HAF family extracellular repeat protein